MRPISRVVGQTSRAREILLPNAVDVESRRPREHRLEHLVRRLRRETYYLGSDAALLADAAPPF